MTPGARGGYADAARTRDWTRDTVTNVFSTTKTMVALCALILADRGDLDLYARRCPAVAAGRRGLILSGDGRGYSIQTEQGDTSVNDCTLHAADIGDIADIADIGDIADAWASGFGIYPALETVSVPAGAARGGPPRAGRSGASRRLAVAGLVLGAIGLCALIADVATVITHG